MRKKANSIQKREFVKIYHQSGAKRDDENSNFNFFFGENLNSLQVGNGHLEVDILTRKADNTNFIGNNDNTNEVIRLVNITFAYTNHDACNSTSAGTEIVQNKFVGSLSTIMGLITQSVRDLASFFDKIGKSENANNKTSLKQIPLTTIHKLIED